MVEQNYQPPAADITPNLADSSAEGDLMAFIGPKSTDYYIERFRRIEEGKSLSWHWPAFFLTSGWLLYRKMWLLALGYIIVLPLLATFLSAAVSAAVNDALGGFLYLAYVGATFLVIPWFASRVYHSRARARIDKINSFGYDERRRRRSIEAAGGTNIVAALLIMIIPIVGILAAIAIPAYQDYTIRAQISEGLALAAPAKVAVSEYYMAEGAFPYSNAEAGIPESGQLSGNFVVSVDVDAGSIIITYGNDAITTIVGKTLSLVPYEQSDGSVVWECGADMPAKWLPPACR